jgi:hypothetical protein
MTIKGRPPRSDIRDNIIEILYYLEKGYGYQLCKIYFEIFPKVTPRSIYYHLKKGVLTQEFEVEEVKTEHGEFSWGSSVEKIIYRLGPKALPKGSNRVKEVIERWKK